MADTDAVPEWLQKLQPGDPVEVTIRGTLTQKLPGYSHGSSSHLLMTIRYGEPHERTSQFDGPDPVNISWPPPAGLTIKGFVLTPDT